MNARELKVCPICGEIVHITETKIGTPYNNGQSIDYYAKIECLCGLTFEREWVYNKASNGTVKLQDDIFDVWNNQRSVDYDIAYKVAEERAREIFENIERIVLSDEIDEDLKYDEEYGASVAISRIAKKIDEIKHKYIVTGQERENT